MFTHALPKQSRGGGIQELVTKHHVERHCKKCPVFHTTKLLLHNVLRYDPNASGCPCQTSKSVITMYSWAGLFEAGLR